MISNLEDTPAGKFSSRPGGITVVGAAFSRRLYARIAEYYGAKYSFLMTLGFGAMAAVGFSIAVFAVDQYVRLQRLGHGAHAVGRIVELDIGAKDMNRATYLTKVSYTFDAPGDRKYTGSTTRRLNGKPDLATGGAIDVLYDTANPALNTMSEGVADDLGDRLSLAGIGVFCGLFFGVYVLRYRQWRSARGDG